jgi:putative ABC transport system permease protein
MRKVLGSERSQLIVQFLSESLLTTCVAMVLALILASGSVLWLRGLSGVSFLLDASTGLLLAGFLVILLLVVGILAGLYPAFALAGFKPISVLKGAFRSTKQGRRLRVGLVVFQFTVSIGLIASTAVIQKQLHYINTRDVGYDREQVVLFSMVDATMAENQQVFRDALLQHSSFVSAAPSSNVPGRTFGRTRVRPEGVSDDDIWIWSQFAVGPETLPTLDMEIAQGRNFSRERGTDSSGVALVNETAVRQLGWDEPLHKRLFFGPQDSVGTEVIGVVKDFNFANIHQNIEPVVIFPLNTSPGSLLAARIEPGRITEALDYAEEQWRTVYPDYPFTYTFLDEEFNNLYVRDRTTGKIVNIFSALAILIACLGLFGLASHATTQRTKEIGVRKVLGASSRGIIRMLVMDFTRWVALANVVAWPLAWYASSRWLEGFAYRVDVDPALLLLATLIALVISVLTVLGQSWRAAAMNPARALRYE